MTAKNVGAGHKSRQTSINKTTVNADLSTDMQMNFNRFKTIVSERDNDLSSHQDTTHLRPSRKRIISARQSAMRLEANEGSESTVTEHEKKRAKRLLKLALDKRPTKKDERKQKL
jgi:hypothetical protein